MPLCLSNSPAGRPFGSPGMQAFPGLGLSCQGRTGKGGRRFSEPSQVGFPRSTEHGALQVSSPGWNCKHRSCSRALWLFPAPPRTRCRLLEVAAQRQKNSKVRCWEVVRRLEQRFSNLCWLNWVLIVANPFFYCINTPQKRVVLVVLLQVLTP